MAKSNTGDRTLDRFMDKNILDGAAAAARIGDKRLLNLMGARVSKVTVDNKNYAGDAAWERYRTKVALVEARYLAAVKRHKERIASGAYDSNPVWIQYQSKLSAWTKKKDATIAAWKKQSADLLAAWQGGRQTRVLTAINDLRISRRTQMRQIKSAAEAFRSGTSKQMDSEMPETTKQQSVDLIPSLSDLLAPKQESVRTK